MAFVTDGVNNEITDSAGREVLAFTLTASAVNELTVASAATAGKPAISLTGDDTNISGELIPKGTGGWAIGSGGAPIAKIIKGSTTWDPASIADGAIVSTTVTVTGAAVGDPAWAGFTTLTTQDATISAHVSAADTVKVVITNRTGGNLDLASGTLTAAAIKFA